MSLHEIRATKSRGLELEVEADVLSPSVLNGLQGVLAQEQFQGNCQLFLSVLTNEENGFGTAIIRSPNRVKPGDDLNHALKSLMGGRCTIRMR